MKKVFAISAIVILAAGSLVSCKKTYTCDFGGGVTQDYPNLTSSEATTTKTACTAAGGTWSTK